MIVDYILIDPSLYTHITPSMRTEKLDDHQKLGQGGFGCVYKGVLPDHYTQLAVKKFKGVGRQGSNERGISA